MFFSESDANFELDVPFSLSLSLAYKLAVSWVHLGTYYRLSDVGAACAATLSRPTRAAISIQLACYGAKSATQSRGF